MKSTILTALCIVGLGVGYLNYPKWYEGTNTSCGAAVRLTFRHSDPRGAALIAATNPGGDRSIADMAGVLQNRTEAECTMVYWQIQFGVS